MFYDSPYEAPKPAEQPAEQQVKSDINAGTFFVVAFAVTMFSVMTTATPNTLSHFDNFIWWGIIAQLVAYVTTAIIRIAR